MVDYNQKALTLHKKLNGKIEIKSKIPIRSKNILSTIYTPGVGAVSSAIAKDGNLVWELTGRKNTVAIISDGTAVLGLGNIGPEAALPVMEGKAVLFSEFGGVWAYPLCIKSKSVAETVQIIRAIAPSFGGINLEDVAAPACFEVEEQLSNPPEGSPRGEVGEASLGIPVFHDDQDGTAVVVLAALYNSVKVTGKKMSDLKVVILGAGAAGSAVAWLLLGREKWDIKKVYDKLFFDPPKDIVIVDSRGIISQTRTDLNKWKQTIAKATNKQGLSGDLAEALTGADVFIGVSTGGKLDAKLIKLMDKDPIIFAMSNPNPEILPDDAKAAGAAIVATGRSDFANQVNNALVFPGMFRGLLDAGIKKVTIETKLAAASALANSVVPTAEQILPDVVNKKIHQQVAQAVRRSAS